jgi:hypothetical protein
MRGWRTIITASDTWIIRPNVQVALLGPHVRRQHQMASIIPANNHGLLPLVSENAEGSGGECEEPSVFGERPSQRAVRTRR